MDSLENDGSIYTGFLSLEINSDGEYNMYDSEGGNPAIKGKLEIKSDDEMIFIDESDADFDPPPKWDNMSKEQTISYSKSYDESSDKTQLKLTYTENENSYTLIFTRDGV